MQPGQVVPMKLVTAGVMPRGNFIYQLKWDGVRMLAFISTEGVVLQNRQLRIRTAQYPELKVLQQLLQGKEAIIDGEVVVPTQKLSTSFQSVIRRDFATNPGVIREFTQTLPVHYIVFDILRFNHQPLLNISLSERLGLLRKHLDSDTGSVSIIEDFNDGDSLYAATDEMGLEGIVAKNPDSPYLPGERSVFWQKVKHRRRETFYVLGYTMRSGMVNSLVLGLMQPEGGFRIAGRAGSGLTAEHARMLTTELPKLQLNHPPSGFPKDALYVHPYLTVDIEFMEWTEDGVVRAPSIKGFGVGGDNHGNNTNSND